MQQTTITSKQQDTIILVFLTVIFGVVLFRSAWITEDAYITLRTVDNFINGYGLTWNVAERVQVYTHPLWMLALSGLYWVTHEAFYTTLALSFVASIGAFILVQKNLLQHNLATLAGLSILIFSKSFIDFSTSGLENPATHFLLALFLLLFLGPDPLVSRKRIFLLSLIACLATVNRMDTLLFFIPALSAIILKQWSKSTIKWVLLGFSPFFAWEIFSIFYYGFPFPNTAYAKLYTGLARMDLLEQGYLYFVNSLHWDPITLFTIVGALVISVFWGTRRERLLAVGLVMYLFYVFWIGADYMSGRFLSAALLISVVMINRHLVNISQSAGLFFLAMIFMLGFISPTPTMTSIDDLSFSTARTDINGISDERSFYFQPSSLMFDRRDTIEPFHDWVFRGMTLKAEGPRVQPLLNVGYIGYFGGPQIFIIDRLALADPLLARLPPIKQDAWTAGHFERAIPEGYFESVKNDQNRIADPNLARYYQLLRLVTRAPLWSWERMAAIWALNTGQANVFLQAYHP